MSIEQFADTLLEKLKTISRAETVIGEPIISEGATIVPVSRVSVGFGIGGRASKAEMNGSAGGASIEPVAFLVMKGENIQVMPIAKNSNFANKVLDLVPEVLDIVKKNKKNDDSE